MWILCMAMSAIFCVTGWIMRSKSTRMVYWSSVCSLAFVSISLLMQYNLVVDWVQQEDWSALLDVVPTMFSLLSGYVIVMILANALLIGFTKKK